MIGISLTGADGSFWDLRSGPVRMVAEAAEGFGPPKYTRPVRSTPNRAGQRRTGKKSSVAAREGFLPVEMVPQPTEDDYFGTREAWWKAWDPDRPSTLTVTRPNGTTRSLTCYFSDEDYAPDVDPTVDLSDTLSLSWVADDPWWRGERVVRDLFLAADAPDFLAGGTAPPFALSASNSVGGSTVSNPGDEPAWPLYRVGAGAREFAATLDGAAVQGAITVPDGYELLVDSAAQVALLRDGNGNDTNVTPRLSAAAFRPIPPGAKVPLTTAITGAIGTRFAVEFSPLYRRAW